MTLWASLETGDSWVDLSLSTMLGVLQSRKATSTLLNLLLLGVRAVPGRGEVFGEEVTFALEES